MRDRPELEELLDWVREDDVVHVHSMDRLARNVTDLREIVAAPQSDSQSTAEHLKNQILWPDTHHQGLIRERQREGIEVVKKRGAYKGRKRALCSATIKDLKARRAAGEGVAGLARKFGVSRQTVYAYL